jgi:hypothetical protein
LAGCKSEPPTNYLNEVFFDFTELRGLNFSLVPSTQPGYASSQQHLAIVFSKVTYLKIVQKLL